MFVNNMNRYNLSDLGWKYGIQSESKRNNGFLKLRNNDLGLCRPSCWNLLTFRVKFRALNTRSTKFC